MATEKVTQEYVEVLSVNPLRVSQEYVEVLRVSPLRVTQEYVEVLSPQIIELAVVMAGAGDLSASLSGTFAIATTMDGQGDLSASLSGNFAIATTMSGEGNLRAALFKPGDDDPTVTEADEDVWTAW